MIVTYHPKFKKQLKSRLGDKPKIRIKFYKRLELFVEDVQNPLLKNHHLTGSMREFWAFSVTGDIRVIYRKLSEDEAELFDIGSHNQVY